MAVSADRHMRQHDGPVHDGTLIDGDVDEQQRLLDQPLTVVFQQRLLIDRGLGQVKVADLVQQLTEQMHSAAAELQFELAARLRDEISELKKELRQMVEAGAR